jgi:hypothetical protein
MFAAATAEDENFHGENSSRYNHLGYLGFHAIANKTGSV